MSCPLGGDPVDDLPVYGAAPARPRPEPRPDSDRRAPSRRGLLVALGAVAALIAVSAAVSALTGRHGPAAHVLDSDERFGLPAAVARAPHIAWRRRVDANGLVAVGGVVVAADDHGVAGYSARTGERRWRLPAGRDGLPGISRLGADRVLLSYGPANHGEGGLRALVVDADDGRVRWRFRGLRAEFAEGIGDDHVALLSTAATPRGTVGLTVLSADHGTVEWTAAGYPVATSEDAVYLVDDEHLVAVELDRGRRRWSRDISTYRAESRGATVVADTVVLARSDTTLVGLSAADGTVTWTHALAHPVSMLRSAGDVVVAIGGSEAVGLDPRSGHELWHAPAEAWRGFPYVDVDGHDGVYALGQGITRLDPRSGHTLAAAGEPTISDYFVDASALAAGVLYVPRDRQHLDALDAGTLQRRWSIAVDGSLAALAAADRTLVVSTGDELVAYR
jgi:outer membrane protein assembly factor BamB